ncbi:hypothetical protein [Prevotella corporis]|nr:hypothetical protein [Prevotella corporis]
MSRGKEKTDKNNETGSTTGGGQNPLVRHHERVKKQSRPGI